MRHSSVVISDTRLVPCALIDPAAKELCLRSVRFLELVTCHGDSSFDAVELCRFPAIPPPPITSPFIPEAPLTTLPSSVASLPAPLRPPPSPVLPDRLPEAAEEVCKAGLAVESEDSAFWKTRTRAEALPLGFSKLVEETLCVTALPR